MRFGNAAWGEGMSECFTGPHNTATHTHMQYQPAMIMLLLSMLKACFRGDSMNLLIDINWNWSENEIECEKLKYIVVWSHFTGNYAKSAASCNLGQPL